MGEEKPFFSKLWEEVQKTKKTIDMHTTGKKTLSSLSAEELKDKIGSKADMAVIIKSLYDQLKSNLKIMKKSSDEIELYRKKECDSAKSIVTLQRDIINANTKKTEDLTQIVTDSISSTVKQEIKLYNEVVKKNIDKTTPINIGGIKSVVKDAIVDVKKETDRKKSVVVFGLEEEEENEGSENLTLKFGNLLDNIEVSAVMQQAYRIGRKVAGKIRPLRVVFDTIDSVHNLLHSAKKLRHFEIYENVYVSIDRNAKEIEAHRELVRRLKKKIMEFPDKYWYIKNNEIISGQRKMAPK